MPFTGISNADTEHFNKCAYLIKSRICDMWNTNYNIMKMTKPQNDILSGVWMLIWIHFDDRSFISGVMAHFWLAVKCEKCVYFFFFKYHAKIFVSLQPEIWEKNETNLGIPLLLTLHDSLNVKVKIAKQRLSHCMIARAIDKLKYQRCHSYFSL